MFSDLSVSFCLSVDCSPLERQRISYYASCYEEWYDLSLPISSRLMDLLFLAIGKVKYSSEIETFAASSTLAVDSFKWMT